MRKTIIAMFIFQLSGICLFAQGIFKKDKAENDTTYHITLDTVNIIERSLINYNYNRYERIVGKIYPIADTALCFHPKYSIYPPPDSDRWQHPFVLL